MAQLLSVDPLPCPALLPRGRVESASLLCNKPRHACVTPPSSVRPSGQSLNLTVVLGTLKLAAAVRVSVVLETPNLSVTAVSVALGFGNLATLKTNHCGTWRRHQHSHPRPWGHSVPTPIPVDRCLLSHPTLSRVRPPLASRLPCFAPKPGKPSSPCSSSVGMPPFFLPLCFFIRHSAQAHTLQMSAPF